jgi:hypothetical protein
MPQVTIGGFGAVILFIMIALACIRTSNQTVIGRQMMGSDAPPPVSTNSPRAHPIFTAPERLNNRLMESVGIKPKEGYVPTMTGLEAAKQRTTIDVVIRNQTAEPMSVTVNGSDGQLAPGQAAMITVEGDQIDGKRGVKISFAVGTETQTFVAYQQDATKVNTHTGNAVLERVIAVSE